MNKAVCPDCGVRMVECRRYRLEPLAAFMRMTMSQTCIEVRLAGSTQKRGLCHGITRRVVDRIAAELKEHPAVIWPEIVDHDIEDTTLVCAADGCEERFVPHPRATRQKFCSKGCCRRHNDKVAYHAKPDWRARRLAKARRWHAENAERISEERRTPTGRKVSAKYQRERYRRDPVARARKIAQNQEYKRQRREEAA